MMKRTLLLLALVALGCQRSGLDSERLSGGLLITTDGSDWSRFVASEAGMIAEPRAVGRATESRFQPKDQIGIFLYSGSFVLQSTNMRYFTQDGTPTGSTVAPKWLAGDAMGGRLVAGTTYYGAAYYPYKVGAQSVTAVPHTVAVDQSTIEGKEATALEQSDFLWAAPVAVVDPTSSPAVGLNFKHAMTKMVVNLDVPMVIDGYAVTNTNSISIKGLNTSCTVDLSTGVVKGHADVASITPRLLSGDMLPGKRSVWEAVVVPQVLDVNHALIEIKCQTSAGEKAVNYFPPGVGLTLEGGTRVTFMLTSSADLAITSELDLFTGEAETLPMKVKTTSGTAWTFASSQPTWLTVSTTAGGAFGTSITGVGTGAEQTVYVRTVANTGVGAISRDGVLTLSATLAGQVRSVTYRAVQNYSVPVTGFPETYVWMAGCQYELPKVKGNSKWYIKATSLPSSVKFSTRNVAWADLQAEDVVDVVGLTNTGSKLGFEVLGNYFNTGGSLYVVTDPTASPLATVVCNGVNVTIDARSILVAAKDGSKLRWAKGHLVAASSTAQAVMPNTNGAKVVIGSRYDGGLYFQFGSLIGWKGGASKNGGSGVGIPDSPAMIEEAASSWSTGANYTTFSWDNDAMVWPSAYTNGPTAIATTWPTSSPNTVYFGLNTPGTWDQIGQKLSSFEGFTENKLVSATVAVGDPCRYYLGQTWRMPTMEDYGNLFRNYYPNGTVGSWSGYSTPWGTLLSDIGAVYANVVLSGSITVGGIFVNVSDMGSPNVKESSTNLFFSVAGSKQGSGLFSKVPRVAYAYMASIVDASRGTYLYGQSSSIIVWNTPMRYAAVPIRCVCDE